MTIEMLRAKIHRLRITQLELDYVGSITLDEALLDASGILPNQKVQVVNVNNGARFETYAIKGPRGSGIAGLNGPCARLAMPNDVVIVMAYAQMSLEEAKQNEPTIIFPNENNLLS